MNQIDKMFSAIDSRSKIPLAYQLSTAELLAVNERYAGSRLDLAIAMYRYGFSRGKHYAKNGSEEAEES